MGVRVIALDRPDRRNALSLAVMRELIGKLDAAATDSSVRVIILAAEGKAFSSGHDLAELTGCGADRNSQREIFRVCTELMQRIHTVPHPVIAQVQGVATAAGCQLVATCDLAVASENASFATPGVRIGLFCSTPMVALSRAIGRKRALEMLLTGRAIDAATAAEWGLVNRVVPAEMLAQETMALAEQIASASGYTVGLGKRAFYRQIEIDEAGAYAFTQDVMVENALAADAHEGMTAFLEKRKPQWQQDRSAPVD